MRAWAIALLAFTLLPLAATRVAAEPHRRECVRLTKQIGRYMDDVERARDRDNELWENATLQQIDRLATRRARLCPQYAHKDDPTLRRLAALLGSAAKLAARYFTFGAL